MSKTLILIERRFSSQRFDVLHWIPRLGPFCLFGSVRSIRYAEISITLHPLQEEMPPFYIRYKFEIVQRLTSWWVSKKKIYPSIHNTYELSQRILHCRGLGAGRRLLLMKKKYSVDILERESYQSTLYEIFRINFFSSSWNYWPRIPINWKPFSFNSSK